MESHGSDGSCQTLAASVQAKISNSSPQFSARDCCIYRVPPLLRQHNEKAYTPAVVSIGPFHHNDPRLLPMESHKLSYLQSFLNCSPQNMNLSSYLSIVKVVENDIRRCYVEPIHLSSDDFIQMVLIDSVFIIELFRRCSEPYLIRDDYVYNRCVINTVARDIKLEENQLPFFILVRLYTAAFKSDANLDQVPCFTDLAINSLDINKSKINIDATTKEATWCRHLLDLLRSNYKPSDLRTNGDEGRDHVNIDIKSPVCPTATSLFAAGVRFQVINPVENSSNLLDIYFNDDKGILYIPKLRVVDRTEYLLRNLEAFEQCHYHMADNYFTYYRYFLDCLMTHTRMYSYLPRQASLKIGWEATIKCPISSTLSVMMYFYLSSIITIWP